MQRFEAAVDFKCPACGNHVHRMIDVSEPAWGAADRMSDLYSEENTEIECPSCTTNFNAYVTCTGFDCEVTLDDFPATSVNCGTAGYSAPDEGDSWWINDVPAEPEAIFLDSYDQVGEVLAEHGGEAGTHLVNRMVFAQQVSAFEAYLGDTLVNHVLGDPAAVGRLLASDRHLQELSFSLADISKNPNLVTDEVKGYLKGVLYHRFDTVGFLYKKAIGVDMWSSQEARATLFKAVVYRHDCVHRNGFDKDNKRLDVFSKAYVQEVADAMKEIVAHIESQLRAAPEGEVASDATGVAPDMS